MIMSNFLALLCILILPSTSAIHYDCPYKECYCDGNTIMCTNLGLNSTPQITSNNTAGITTLYLDLNNISTIPSGSLPAHLVEINLDENPTATVYDTAFIGSADTLQTLSFSGAQFTDITKAMVHLRALKQFDIYNSNVRKWNDDIMKSIGSNLESLTLENAGVISSLAWIQYFPYLTELIIEGCLVSSLPDNVLGNLTGRLVTLSFNNNSLTVVPKDLSKLSNIRKLDLGNNKISDISWLPRCCLTALVLNNNRIYDAALLSSILRPSANSLATLTLQENQLESIPELGFLRNILKLDLTYNRISDPYSGSLPAVMFGLDLGYNFLPYIPRVMSNLTRLLDLTLISNVVREIAASDFPPGMVWVHLGYNLITELKDSTSPQILQ